MDPWLGPVSANVHHRERERERERERGRERGGEREGESMPMNADATRL